MDELAELLETGRYAHGVDIGNASLYKVDVPDEYIPKMLHWNKPLYEQPEIQKELEDIVLDLYGDSPYMKDINVRQHMHDGEGLYTTLTQKLGTKKAASSYLSERGIPGIKYFDGGSRGKGKGTSNFVVFPGFEDKVKVLERNGVSFDSPEFATGGPGSVGARALSGVEQEGKIIEVYHGGNMDMPTKFPEGMLFTASDKSVAEEYAKLSKGAVKPYKIDAAKIADEREAYEVMESLNISPLNKEWTVKDSNLNELLDPNFEQFIGYNAVEKFQKELVGRGYDAVSTVGYDVRPTGSGRNTIAEIILLNANPPGGFSKKGVAKAISSGKAKGGPVKGYAKGGQLNYHTSPLGSTLGGLVEKYNTPPPMQMELLRVRSILNR